MEITVSPNRDLVTLINVFVVEPGNQEKLIGSSRRAPRRC